MPGTMLTDVVPVQIPGRTATCCRPPAPASVSSSTTDRRPRSSFELTEIPHLHRADGSFTNW